MTDQDAAEDPHPEDPPELLDWSPGDPHLPELPASAYPADSRPLPEADEIERPEG